jgi:hypothetical protein
MRGFARALTGAAAVALVAACGAGGSGAGSSPSGTPAPTVVTTTTTTTTTTTPPSSPAATTTAVSPVIADGRHPAYLTRVDADRREVTVDVVQFFTGDAASRAAEEDDAPEVPPPNDYWIRNSSKQLRVLPVAPDAVITVNPLAAEETGSATEDVTVSLARLSQYPYTPSLFWITAEDGTLTRIAEQFLP